jgi:hypothetical protein
MQSQDETILLPEYLIEVLSIEARKGLLFLILIEENIELVFLSELVKSPESIDELINLPVVRSDSKSIGIEKKFLSSLLQKFK